MIARRMRGPLTVLGLLMLSACGPQESALPLGFSLTLAAQPAVPLESIAAFEVGAVRGLPNDDCLPFASRPAAPPEPVVCPRVANPGELLELRDGDGAAQRTLRFTPTLSTGGRQQLAISVPVGDDTSLLVQALDASGGYLGSGCAFVGRVTISSIEFNGRTAELNLHESYTACQPILP
jgi:hypothetical protein